MVRPLMGTLGEQAGLVPTAMMMRSGLERRVGLRPFHAQLVRIDKMGNAVDHVDAVARKLRLGHVHFGLDHRLTRKARSAMVIFSLTR